MQKAILEEQIEGVALQLPALPLGIKEVLVKMMPYLAILGLILGGIALIGLAVGTAAVLTLGLGPLVFLSSLMLLASFILTALAVPGLFSKSRAGWVWLYYAELIGLLSNLLALSPLGVLISLVRLYALFQIREMYA